MTAVPTTRLDGGSAVLLPPPSLLLYTPPMTADPAPPLLQIEDLHLHELGGPAQGQTVHAVDGISFARRERRTALGVGGRPATAWLERSIAMW